jgi:hypothetical protein
VEVLEGRVLPSTVTNLNDSGAGSLRAAINSTPAGGTVDFAAGLTGTITLSSSNLPIIRDLHIIGPGARVITVSGNAQNQIFNIPAGVTVTISDLTIANGVSGIIAGQPNALGGGIFNNGTLTLSNSVVTSNVANSTLLSSGFGGGIFNSGGMTIINSLIVNNTAQALGSVSGVGGGIYNTNGMSLINVTITGNIAGNGAGIANASTAVVAVMNITNATIASNNAGTTGQGGGLLIGSNSTVNLLNTIVARNIGFAGTDVSGFITPSTAFNNLIGDGSGSSGVADGSQGNQVGTTGSAIDPMLGVLQNNGGPTNTLALLAGSRAIDRGTNIGAPGTDQRGFNRPVNGTPDIGAYEFQQPETATTLTINPNPGTTGQAVTFTATVRGTASNSNLPMGNVSFLDGGSSFATVPLVNGAATFTRAGFSAGGHTITATYNGFTLGNFVFNSSTSQSTNLNIRTLKYFAIGGAAGLVNILSKFDGSLVSSFAPFGIFPGGVSVALGDVNNDGFPDLIVGATTGNPHVKVYDGRSIINGSFNAANPDANLLESFFAYGLQFNIGANVAFGKISNNLPVLVTGATAGNPHVKVFNMNGFNPSNPDASLVASFFAYGLQFNVGANVAVGDVNNDGFGDVITGATAGNPHVKVYNGRDIANRTFNNNNPDASLLASFFAFGLQFNIGAFVTVGDTNRDGFPDLIVGASSGNPQVKVYNGRAFALRTFSNSNPDASLLNSFFAFDIGFNIGTSVAAADFNGDGNVEILTGASAGAPNFRLVRGNATGIRPPVVNGIDGFSADITGGILVGA